MLAPLKSILSVVLLQFMLPVGEAHATVTEFTNFSPWESAVGPVTTVPFTGFPGGTIITSQYSSLGVLFPDGNDNVFLSSAFSLDGAGLNGFPNDPIHISFQTPQSWIGVYFPGIVQFELFNAGQLVYSSSDFFSGIGTFAGLVSTTPFDAALIRDPFDSSVDIDNLYFGVPGPGPLPLLAVALLLRRRRLRASLISVSPIVGKQLMIAVAGGARS